MRRVAVALAVLLIVPFARAQERAVSEKIIEAAMSSHAGWWTLQHLTDEIGPRLSGSKGAEAAVAYTTERLRSWGFEVRQEPIMVPHWVRGTETAKLVSHLDQPVFVTALGGSVATPAEGITAEVIAVSSLEEAEKLGDRAKGKIVLFNRQMSVELAQSGRAFDSYSEVAPLRTRGASVAASQGAVAALVRSLGTTSLRTPHTGAMRYDEKQPKIPSGAITWEDAELINRLLLRGEKVVMHLTMTPQTLSDVPSANVVVEIKGREKPEEIVVIGGHLDSWDLGTGAIDNGSGVAMVMDTMRILKASGVKPRRTVRMVLFMNEENGLRGGRGYFDAHKNETHAAAIESDAGVAKPIGFSTTLSDESQAKLLPHLAPFDRIAKLTLVYSKSTGADTSPLTAAGVTGFGFIPDPKNYFDYHHTPADTLDKVNPQYLREDTAAVALLTYVLAEMPEMLK